MCCIFCNCQQQKKTGNVGSDILIPALWVCTTGRNQHQDLYFAALAFHRLYLVIGAMISHKLSDVFPTLVLKFQVGFCVKWITMHTW